MRRRSLRRTSRPGQRWQPAPRASNKGGHHQEIGARGSHCVRRRDSGDRRLPGGAGARRPLGRLRDGGCLSGTVSPGSTNCRRRSSTRSGRARRSRALARGDRLSARGAHVATADLDCSRDRGSLFPDEPDHPRRRRAGDLGAHGAGPPRLEPDGGSPGLTSHERCRRVAVREGAGQLGGGRTRARAAGGSLENLDTTYGSDRNGVVWGYSFEPGAAPSTIGSEEAARALSGAQSRPASSFLWLHLPLANAASERRLRSTLRLRGAVRSG